MIRLGLLSLDGFGDTLRSHNGPHRQTPRPLRRMLAGRLRHPPFAARLRRHPDGLLPDAPPLLPLPGPGNLRAHPHHPVGTGGIISQNVLSRLIDRHRREVQLVNFHYFTQNALPKFR